MLYAIPAVLLTALVTAGGAVPQPTGQDGPTAPDPALAALTIDIWPEYDDPRVLVIYDGMLESGGELPAELTFVVPADAQVHMAGGIAANGGHLHADFDTRLRDDGLMEVSYAPQAPRLYMEFYYDPLSGDDDRRFTYPVVAPFAVDSLTVRVQEPLRATAFELKPAAEGSMQDNRGLDYHLVRWGDLRAGSVTPVTVAYRKSDRQPSVAGRQAPVNGQDRRSRESSSFRWGDAWSWILATLAAGAFVVGFYKLFATRRPGGGGEGGSGRVARPASAAAASFCTECGHPAEPSHRYCGRCGRALREADHPQ